MVEVVVPVAERSIEARKFTVPALPSSRFRPFTCEPLTMLSIWPRRFSTSFCSLVRSSSDVAFCAEMIVSRILPSVARMSSAPFRAVPTDAPAIDRPDEIALKPLTSASIVFEIAQTAALSLAVDTALPVEIWSWVFARFALTPFRVCSATIAPLLVRMLDILSSVHGRDAPGFDEKAF